jgi:hypothetical protein
LIVVRGHPYNRYDNAKNSHAQELPYDIFEKPDQVFPANLWHVGDT